MSESGLPTTEEFLFSSMPSATTKSYYTLTSEHFYLTNAAWQLF